MGIWLVVSWGVAGLCAIAAAIGWWAHWEECQFYDEAMRNYDACRRVWQREREQFIASGRRQCEMLDAARRALGM
jgi:hypothetical protein